MTRAFPRKTVCVAVWKYGTPTTYRIAIDDNGEPGAGLDTFTISTGTGYSASGVLTQGNIQVHA